MFDANDCLEHGAEPFPRPRRWSAESHVLAAFAPDEVHVSSASNKPTGKTDRIMKNHLKIEIKSVKQTDVPLDLLLLADPSIEQIAAYLSCGEGYVAYQGDEPVGEYVIKEKENSVFELMNIAIKEEQQQRGIGAILLQHAIETVKNKGAKKLEVGTGCFGPQLSFYHRAGFRVTSIEKEFFTKNYHEPVYENGIQHKDMLRLAIEF
jgi:ribosomal protein S18 acetylase RimI-like enzyme